MALPESTLHHRTQSKQYLYWRWEGGADMTLTTARFETFWDAYPRKAAKKAARAAFARVNPDHVLFTQMLDAIATQKVSRQWREGFIPHPATWLNGERWTDDVGDQRPVPPASGPTKTQVRSQRNAAAAAAVIAAFEAETEA